MQSVSGASGIRLIGLALIISLCAACNQPEVLIDVEGQADINGSSVFYRKYAFGADQAGAFKKEPLLIVHGGPVMDHSYFLPYLDELAQDYQLIFYDQRACGKSSVDIDSATMSLDGFVEDIELLRKELGFEKMNLLGHSWGGLLAMKYGIKYSDNLNKLVLSNAMAPSAVDWQRENQVIGQRVTERDRQERAALVSSGALQSGDPREAVKTLLLQSFKHQMYDTANLAKLDLFVPLDYMQRSRIFGLLSRDLATYDLYNSLVEINCPTLLIYGETEAAPSLYANKVLTKLTQGSMKVIPKAGHFPFVEAPAGFATEVKDFLRQ